jgi:hypothetical protein
MTLLISDVQFVDVSSFKYEIKPRTSILLPLFKACKAKCGTTFVQIAKRRTFAKGITISDIFKEERE